MDASDTNRDTLPHTRAWHDRAVLTLTNDVVEATVLPGGGHLCEWRFRAGHGPSQANVLWEAPWRTADPGSTAHTAIAAECDDHDVGRFLASFTGHALCLDGFGPASASDAKAGVPLHGEAPNVLWEFTQDHNHSALGVAELPVAGLTVSRQFLLMPEESVLRVREQVTNQRNTERSLHWVQHATIGPPLFHSGLARVTASVSDGVTYPMAYEGCSVLSLDVPFTWPFAPETNGSQTDLRELFARAGSGFVVAARQIAGREYGFVAGCEGGIGLAMGYLYRADLFPWVTFWEENRTRRSPPWRGQTQARGMEFGTTPLPLGNEVIEARGPLFGEPTSRRIGPHETLHASWVLFVAVVPPSWREIEDVQVEANEIVLINRGQHLRLRARDIAAFLRDTSETEKARTL